jgi:hypothetical protein
VSNHIGANRHDPTYQNGHRTQREWGVQHVSRSPRTIRPAYSAVRASMSQSTPCDGCGQRRRCAAQEIACARFADFVAGRELEGRRRPSRRIFARVFHYDDAGIGRPKGEINVVNVAAL